MSLILDIFGSVVIAGMLFMLIVKLNLFSSQTSYISDNELKLIQNAKTLAEIIDYDFRKVGYRHDKSAGSAIKTASSTEFEFYADIDTIGNVKDSIRYWTVPSSKPGFMILKRTINVINEMNGPSLGLDSIKFTYLYASHDTIPYADLTTKANLDKIKYIKTEMWVKSDYAVKDAYSNDSSYSKTYWEFTINPRNL
ncbi:MAG: hypothetical protein WAV89_01815 [Ignavibacteriaceae bacterium]